MKNFDRIWRNEGEHERIKDDIKVSNMKRIDRVISKRRIVFSKNVDFEVKVEMVSSALRQKIRARNSDLLEITCILEIVKCFT